jgi:hypothetical protein
MQRPLPAEAYQFAEMYRLGKPTIMHTINVRSLIAALWFSITMCLLCLCLFGILFIFSYGVIISYQWNLFLLALVILAIIGCCIPFYFALRFFGELVRNTVKTMVSHPHAYFCPEGFVYIYGDKKEVFHWSSIESVEAKNWRSSQWTLPQRVCEVLFMDGSRKTLSNELGGSLASHIKRRVTLYRKKDHHE